MASPGKARNLLSQSDSISGTKASTRRLSVPVLSRTSTGASTEELVVSLSDKQVDTQRKTFTRWVNSFLCKAKPPIKVEDLFEDMKDGTKLLALLEVLSGAKLPREKGKRRPHFLGNVGNAITFLTDRKVKLVNIHRESIVDGNPTLTLGLIWAIICHYQVQGFYAAKKKVRTKKNLLEWCQKSTQKVAGSSEGVKDFRSSWRNGQAFLYLIHTHRPDLIDISLIETRDNRTNLETAFELAEKHLSVPKLLEVDDVDVDRPDERSILMYVSYLSDKLADFAVKAHLARAQAAVQVPGKRSVKDVALTAQLAKRRESAGPRRPSTSPEQNLGVAKARLSASTSNLGVAKKTHISASASVENLGIPTTRRTNSRTGHLSVLRKPTASLSNENLRIPKKPRMSASSENLSVRRTPKASENPKSRRLSVPAVTGGKRSSVSYSRGLSPMSVDGAVAESVMDLDSQESDLEESQDEESGGEESAEELAELYQDFLRWLSNAEDKLSLMEEQWLKDEEEEDKSDNQQAKKTQRRRQLQVFRKEIQKREYYISRIVEAGTERHAILEENITVVVRRWEVTKRKVTVLEERLWEVGTSVRIGSRLSNLLLWLHEAESLIGSLGTGDEKAIDVPPKFLLKQHENFFRDQEVYSEHLSAVLETRMDEDIVVEESLIKSVESRFVAVREEAAKRWLKLTYEKLKSKTLTLLHGGRQQLSNPPVKFTSQEHVEQVLGDHVTFFHEKKHFKNCKKSVQKLSAAAVSYVNVLEESRKAELIDLSRGVEEQWQKLAMDVTIREKLLEDLQRKWRTFDTLLSTVTAWVQKADVLIRGFDLKKCKEFLKNIEKVQTDANTVHDCSKAVLANCLDRVKFDIRQQLQSMDRRMNRIIRRHSRLMKCERKNAKVDKFEDSVDGIMDWIYDTEMLLSVMVESTHAAVVATVEKLETTEREIDSCEANVASLNRSTKTLLKDFKTDMASSVKATLSNIGRRFEKIKSTLPHRHLLMKQIVPQLEVFESGFEEEMRWIVVAVTTLESCRRASSLEEVEAELQKYREVFSDLDRHSQFVESKNQQHQAIKTSLTENIDPTQIQEKIVSLNTKWKVVKAGAETHCTRLDECYRLLQQFENSARTMRSWTFESDLSQASDEELDNIQVSCNQMIETQEQLQNSFPNEQVKKRLRVSAEYIVQEWGEVYNREKLRVLRKHFVDIKSQLESELFRLEQELTAMNSVLKSNGYSKELHQRCQDVFGNGEIDDAFNNRLGNLKEAVEKLKEHQSGDEIEGLGHSLDMRRADLMSNVDILFENLKSTAGNVEEYNQSLGQLVRWVQSVESCIDGLGNVAEYSEFLAVLKNFQSATAEVDSNLQSLERIHQVAREILQQSQLTEIKEQVKSVTSRVHTLLPAIAGAKDQLTMMHRCFLYQKSVQEHSMFLKEVCSRLEVEYCIDCLEDAVKEMETLKSINDSLEDHRDKIQDVITEGRDLTNVPDRMEFVQSEVTDLESQWRKVMEECGDRQDELEHVLDNWRAFTDAMYKFKEILAQGEVELTHRKSVNISVIDIIKAEIEEIKKLKEDLQRRLNEYDFLFELGEKLKLKASVEGAERLDEQLVSAAALRKSLIDELRQHLGHLHRLAQRWQGFQQQMDSFEQYMQKIDSRLTRRRESKMSQEWLTQVKNVSKEMLQRRRSFTVFADEGRHLADGCVDLGAMEMKAKLCTLKERWNELYDIARKTESTAEQGLKPLNEYQEIFEKFTARHEEVTLKLESEIPAFENLEQVNEQIEKDEALLVEMHELREQLDNLIWKGAELAASMRLKDIDIKSTLKELEGKWNQAMQLAEDRVAELDSLRLDWAERERILESLESWVMEAEEQLESEKGLSTRDEISLKDALDNYQNVQQTLEERQSEFDTAVEHYHEIASSRRFIRRESVEEKCINLTEKWNSLSSSVPGRINSLHKEIQGWAGFYNSLDQFTAWLNEMDSFTQRENPHGEPEAQEHLKELEEFQTSFRKRQASFESLIKEGREIRLRSCRDGAADRLNERLTKLTDRWDEMLRWAAGRYQLLVLSQHYLDASRQVVQYLEKIEEKMSAAKDIPPSVLEKIRAESEKAKAKVEHWKEQCFDLDVVVKEGHLMLQQKSSGKAVAFEEQLGNMNEDWNTVILDVQEKKKNIEKTAKKWWDFTRNKLKMIRWLNKKESDADFQGPKGCSLDNAQEQMNRYKGILDRLNVHKKDLEALNVAAQDMLDEDEAGFAVRDIQELITKFENLQKNMMEKQQFFQRVVTKWEKFSQHKQKMAQFFKNTQNIVAKRPIKNAIDCKHQIEECKAANSDLIDSQDMLEAVNEEANELLEDLRQLEGFDIEAVEEELRMVNKQWDLVRVQGGVKQQALELVANEWDELEKGKGEIQNWISGVKKELTKDEGKVEVDLVKMREKIKDQVASRDNQVKRLSLQALKLMEDYADQMDMDMRETFQPLLREWKSVQELAGIPVEAEQEQIFHRLERQHSLQMTGTTPDGKWEECAEMPAFPGKLSQMRKRRKSYGSSSSVGEQLSPTGRERDRMSSFDYSMDTLWSSCSTFSINMDTRDDERENSEDLEESTEKINSALLSVNGNGLDALLTRDREGTLVLQAEENSATPLQNVVGSDKVVMKPGAGCTQERRSRESVDTVTDDETQRPERTREELRAHLDDVMDRFLETSQHLSFCAYAPEDTEEDVERKLMECKNLLEDLQSQRAELDDFKEDIRGVKSNETATQMALTETESKLDECLIHASDTQSELECVIDQFSEYNSTVQEWRAWFYPANATLEACKDLDESKVSLEGKSEDLQVLIEEMDRNDQLIGEVYAKGDILLQVISGSCKASLEAQLNELEEEWAEFCQDTISVKSSVEESLQHSHEYEENRDKLMEWFGEVEIMCDATNYTCPADLDTLNQEIENNQKLTKEMAIQELVLDFVNMKGQELCAKIPEHGNIESEIQTANDSWSTVQRLVSEKAEILHSMANELTQFEANVSKLGDLLNYTEVCLDETETSKEAGLNGLHKQLAKLKALASSFEGRFDHLTDVTKKCLKLKENCSSEGKLAVEGKVQGLRGRWTEVKCKIGVKCRSVEDEITEWTEYMREVDERLTELRNAEITLDAEIIGITDLKVLEDQLATVKSLCDELEENQSYLDQLQSKGRSLVEKAAEDDKQYLQSQLKSLRDLQASVIRKVVSKQEQLIRHMVHQQDFETQLESCMHILREVDTSVAEFVVSGNLQEMKEQLANCQELLQELDAKEGRLADTNHQGRDICDKVSESEKSAVELRLKNLNEEWRNVKEKVMERLSSMESAINAHGEYRELVKQAQGKAADIENLLSDCGKKKLEAVDKTCEEIESKLHGFQSLMALVEEKEKGDELQNDGVATDSTSPAELQSFLKDATERNVSLQKTISFHQQYQMAFIETANYLEDIERRLESVDNGDSFTDQIAKLQDTQTDLEDHCDLLDAVSEKGKLLVMMESCGTEDMIEVEEQIQSLNLRWDALQSAVLERQDDLIVKQEVVSSLEDEVAAVSNKLQELESSTEDLKAVSLGCSDVTNQRENYELLGQEVSSIHSSVEDLTSRCQELLEGVPDKGEELEERLLGLRRQVQSLEGKVEEKKEEFEDTLWRWQEFQGQINTCLHNLAIVEKSLEFQEKGDHMYDDQRRTYLMLCDNLDMQEALISDVKDKGKDALHTFPEPDNETASCRLAELDTKFLLVKEQLKRRKLEMLKSSVDWQEFERGLRNCLEWVESAEQRVQTEIDVSDEELDIGNLKFFSDELDFQVADFESSKSDGKRLLSHVTDQTERETMQRQVNDVSERLEAIQKLVLDKERRVGDRYYQMAEFEVGLKDCHERMDEYRASLCEVRGDELVEDERRESLQELRGELEFIQSLADDLVERGTTLKKESPIVERIRIEGKLEQLKKDLQNLEIQENSLEHDTKVVNGVDATDGKTFADSAAVSSQREKHVASDVTVTKETVAVALSARSDQREEKGKIPEAEPVENGHDSDLESGVSSMESFEGLLKKAPYSTEDERGELGRAMEDRFGGSSSDEGTINHDGGISISPDEYQRLRKSQSTKSDEELQSSSASEKLTVNVVDTGLPVLTITDENGDLAEVGTVESQTHENENLPSVGKLNEGVEQEELSGEETDKPPLDSGVYSAEVTSDGEIHVEPVVESRGGSLERRGLALEDSATATNGEPHEEHGTHELFFDDFDLYGKQRLPKPRETAGDGASSSGDDSNGSLRQDMSHYTIVSDIDTDVDEDNNAGDWIDQTSRDLDDSDYKDTCSFDTFGTKTNEIIPRDKGDSPSNSDSDVLQENHRGEDGYKWGEKNTDKTTLIEPGSNPSSKKPDINVVTSADSSMPDVVSESPKRTLSQEIQHVQSYTILHSPPEQLFSTAEPAQKVQKLNRIPTSSDTLASSGNAIPSTAVSMYSVLPGAQYTLRARGESEITMSAGALHTNPHSGTSVSAATSPVGTYGWHSLMEEDEEPLSESLTVDEFVIELGKLLEKLRAIEDMMALGMDLDENIQDELSKHVALCVQMTKQQGRVDLMNVLAERYLNNTSSSLLIILEERLKTVNELWAELQSRANNKQRALERSLDEVSGQYQEEAESLAISESYPSWRPSPWSQEDIEMGADSPESQAGRDEEEEGLYEENLMYQIELHNLCEVLADIEDAVVSADFQACDVASVKERLAKIQSTLTDLRQYRGHLRALSSKSIKLSSSDAVNVDQQLGDMDKLAQGVIRVLLSRHRELEEHIDKVAEGETHSLSVGDFEAKLAECADYQKGIEASIRALGPLDTETDRSLELLKLQVIQSQAKLHQSLLDFLSRTARQVKEPRKKAPLFDVIHQWDKLKSHISFREQELRVQGVLPAEEPQSRPQKSPKVVTPEKIVPQRLTPVLASSPKSPSKTTPSPLKDVLHKSPKSRKRQYEIELLEFSDWLTSQQNRFQELVAEDDVTVTLEALRVKLNQFQVFARNIHSHKSRVQMLREYLQQHDSSFIEESGEIQYGEVAKLADNMHGVCQENAEWLQTVLLLWQSFEESLRNFTTWLDNFVQKYMNPLRRLPEDSIDGVLLKLMKFRDLERKLNERQPGKDAITYEGEQVLTATGNADVKSCMSQLTDRWRLLRLEGKGERQRLEKLLGLWKEYQDGLDDLVEWLATILVQLQSEQLHENELEALEAQLATLQSYQEDVDSHQPIKDRLDIIGSQLLEVTQGDTGALSDSKETLDNNWTELCALIEEREEELVCRHTDMIVEHLSRQVEELREWFESSRTVLGKPILVLGEATFDDTKKLLGNYRLIKGELEERQEQLEAVSQQAEELKTQGSPGRSHALRNRLQHVAQVKSQVIGLLSEKEELIKFILNRWVDFQRLLAELKTINSWFEEREAAMAQYQRIVTEREFEIALEDVKAMNGFLVTQEEAVNQVLKAGKRLLGDSAFDQEDVQDTLDGVQERWSELNTKVGQYEVWLESSLKAVQSYREALAQINEFLDEAEKTVEEGSSLTGDSDAWQDQLDQLEALRGDLAEVAERINDSREVATDLAQNSDPSVSDQFESDANAVSDRYYSLLARLVALEQRLSEAVTQWKQFEAACADLISWIDLQEGILGNSVSEDESLPMQLQQLDICKRIEEELELHREWLTSIGSMADTLKQRTHSSASALVAPLRHEVQGRFTSLDEQLKSKKSSLAEATKEWTDLQDKIDGLNEWLDETELSNESASALETRERVEKLHNLTKEVDDSQIRLEVLHQRVEDGVLGVTPHEASGMTDQLSHVGERWSGVKEKLNSSLKETKSLLELQDQFELAYTRIRSILEGLEKQFIDAQEIHGMENVQLIEDYEDKFDSYSQQVESLTNLAEKLDQNGNADARFKASLEANLTYVRDLWRAVRQRADELKESLDKHMEGLKEFDHLAEKLFEWMEKLEGHGGFAVPRSSNIDQLKTHFEHVKMCQKELSIHRTDYEKVCNLGQELVQKWGPGTLGVRTKGTLYDVTVKWTMISTRLTGNQQHLELALKDWQQYTSLMENIMVWMKEKEKQLRRPLTASSLREVENELENLRILGREIDERKPQLDLVTKKGETLMKETGESDCERVQKQVLSAASLWKNVCQLLSSAMQVTADILRQYEVFVQLHQQLTDWLASIEESVSRDLEESFLSSADDQGDTVFQVYVGDIESHEAVRSRLNECAFHVISRGSESLYARTVADQQQELNERWRALCQQLGITYKKAEETKYGLKLLEIQLKQLNTWMTKLEERLKSFTRKGSCEISDIQKQLGQLKDVQMDVERHSADVQTVTRLCLKLQHDRSACQTEEQRQRLQRTKEGFEDRWTEVQVNISMRRRHMDERLRLCREFWNDYKKFVDWLNDSEAVLHKAIAGSQSGLELSKIKVRHFQALQKDVNFRRPQIERIIKRSRYLIAECRPDAAEDIRLGVEAAQMRLAAMHNKLEGLLNKQQKLAQKMERFEDVKLEVYAFITDVELRLISLDPYTSEEEPRQQLEKLKALQREINRDYHKIKTLLQEGKEVRELCTSSEFHGIQKSMDEINSRYQQALHCCMSWMLDLAIPSPRHSPSRSSPTRSRTSPSKPTL